MYPMLHQVKATRHPAPPMNALTRTCAGVQQSEYACLPKVVALPKSAPRLRRDRKSIVYQTNASTPAFRTGANVALFASATRLVVSIRNAWTRDRTSKPSARTNVAWFRAPKDSLGATLLDLARGLRIARRQAPFRWTALPGMPTPNRLKMGATRRSTRSTGTLQRASQRGK